MNLRRVSLMGLESTSRYSDRSSRNAGSVAIEIVFLSLIKCPSGVIGSGQSRSVHDSVCAPGKKALGTPRKIPALGTRTVDLEK
jgi:hypothetical protein